MMFLNHWRDFSRHLVNFCLSGNKEGPVFRLKLVVFILLVAYTCSRMYKCTKSFMFSDSSSDFTIPLNIRHDKITERRTVCVGARRFSPRFRIAETHSLASFKLTFSHQNKSLVTLNLDFAIGSKKIQIPLIGLEPVVQLLPG